MQTSFELLTTLFLVYFPKPKMSNDELIILYVNLILFFRFRFEPTHKRLNINFIFFKSFKLEGKYFHCHLDWYRIWTQKESCHVYMVNINRNIMQLRIIEWCVVDAWIRFNTVKRRISNVHVFVLKIYLFVNCVIRNVVQNQLLMFRK